MKESLGYIAESLGDRHLEAQQSADRTRDVAALWTHCTEKVYISVQIVRLH